jgi:hypothetical protein
VSQPWIFAGERFGLLTRARFGVLASKWACDWYAESLGILDKSTNRHKFIILMANDQSVPPRKTDTLKNLTVRTQAFESGVARAQLENFLEAAYHSGPEAQEEYERRLAAIRKAPEDFVVEIAKALGRCESRDYSTRWALVFAACELRHRSALHLLINIATAPIPPEPQPPSHGFSIVGNETVLRTTAIEGIGHLAKEGNKDALEVLFRVLREPSFSLRRASAQAILGVRKSARLIERIKASLAPEQHFILELKRPKVTEVPQISHPRKFLSEEARQRTSVKPPMSPADVAKRGVEQPPTKA